MSPGRGTTLDIAYVGTQSRHLLTSRDINAVPYGYAFTAAVQDPNACGWKGTVGTDPYRAGSPYQAAGYGFTGICVWAATPMPMPPRVPFKGYGQMSYMKFNGTANYNSPQNPLQRRFTKGLTLGAVYTWLHSQPQPTRIKTRRIRLTRASSTTGLRVGIVGTSSVGTFQWKQ